MFASLYECMTNREPYSVGQRTMQIPTHYLKWIPVVVAREWGLMFAAKASVFGQVTF
jgi:hypothetical protein